MENSKKNNIDLKNEKNRIENREIIITSGFEGGNGINFKSYGDDIYSFSPLRDPGEFYSGQAYFFKFSVENKLIREDDTKNITVTAIADFDELWKGWTYQQNPKLWVYHGKNKTQLNPKFVKTTPKTMGINLEILPQEKFCVSNMLAVPYSEMVEILEDIQLRFPTLTTLSKIGNTPLNNSIYSLKVNPYENNNVDENKIKILFAGTAQPNEIGDFASILLLEEFLSKEPDFWDKIHQKLRIEFLFFQNADGLILGKNMVNSSGENIFFGYKNNRDDMPDENKVVWDHIKGNTPDIFFEWHSFFQDNKSIRPYLYTTDLLKSKSFRKLYDKIAKSLISYSNGAKEVINLNQKYFSDTLAYRLQEKFNSLAFQFKLHNGLKIKDLKKIIWDIFLRLFKIINKNANKIKIEKEINRL